MKVTLAACTIGLLGLTGTAFAEGTATSSPQVQAEQSAGVSAGQSIYDTQGAKLGVIQDVTVDAKGEQQAVVDVGTKNVKIAAANLHNRSEGGLVTTLSAEDIAKAPTAK